MKYPLPSVGPARTSRHDPGGDGQSRSCGPRRRPAQQRGGAPYADRSGLDHRPDLIALLPARGFLGGQGRFARLVALQVERPGGAGQDKKRDTRPDQRLARLQRGQGRRDGARRRCRQAAEREFRTANRSTPRERYGDICLIRLSALVCKLHFGCAHVLSERSFTRPQMKSF